MKKSSGSSQKLGSFLSPGAPNYREKSIVSQKGWSSERVLQPTSSSRRQASVGVASLTPFNSGRTIPSKWDDAERWICSPVSGYANNKSCYAQQHQRRPKSKSGPIVPPGTAYYSNYSPTIPLRQGLVVKNLMIGSPFTTGVLAPDALSLHHYYAHDTVFGPRYDMDNGMQMQYSSPVLNENGVALPSVSSAPLWSEMLCHLSSPNSQDEERDGTKKEDTFLKRDKGTQMSSPEAENDAHSSPKSSPTSAMDQKSFHSTKSEVRDVQVDSQATVIRESKQNPLHGKDLKKISTETRTPGLDIAESTTLDTSKLEREEAKIIAWESLQKAKAEAAIRKLEMKLEKKRSSSMDKILNKLRRAQMKAEKMRSIIPVQQDQQVSKTWKVFSFPKYGHIWSPSSCFRGHAP
ncbi:Remorin, C-terminal [Sesbania bispinosa]|nr:Remorin, C-terminal [Sesbania bispinosa]